MKSTQIYILASLTSLACSQLIALPLSFKRLTPHSLWNRPEQQPIMDAVSPALPPGPPGQGNPGSGGGQGSVILSDVMGRDRSINIFAGFTRDIESISRRLDNSAQNSTVLAPLNSAIESLPRKPWEDPADYDTLGADAYEGEDGQERAQRNIRRFVEAHIVPSSPWPKNEKVKPIGSNTQAWWEEKDGVRMVC